MPDQPDERQKQQRRSTALPPFFAPRTTRPTTPAQSGAAAPPRRSSQLFTPPGVPKQPRPTTPPATPLATPLATRRVTPFAAPVVPPAPPIPATWLAAPPAEIDTAMPEAAAPDTAPAEMPNEEQRAVAPESGDAFVIEQFEPTPISLRSTGEHGAVQQEGTLSFQMYDDASRLLERDARPAPADDESAIEIERTEVMFEPPAAEAPLEIESFWAADSVPTAESPHDTDDAVPLGMEPVAEAGSVERATQPMLDAIEPPAHEAMRVPSWLDDVPPELEPPAEPSFEATPSPAIEYAAPTPEPALAASDDAEEALAEAFSAPAPNESVPRWSTPPVNRAVEDDRPTQPNDGWNFAAPQPPDELAAALAWPDSGLRARTPAGMPAIGERADTSHELAASAEGWPLSVAGRLGMPDAVATALERIAQRVRAGDVPLPADVALAKSDESALALTLAALLRAAAPRA